MRSVLFCNEMLGLGHLRRSVAIAGALASGEGDTALVVTGSPAFAGLRLPARVDVIKLPAAPVGRDSAWSSTALRPTVGLEIADQEVTDLRAELCQTIVRQLEPDVVIVDHRPFGRENDLLPALELLRGRAGCTTALGIWESDDSPEVLQSHWTPDLANSIGEFYDLVLVYGPPDDDDLRVAALQDADVPVHSTGFVSTAPGRIGAPDLEPGYLLVMTGGGADGFALLDTFLRAIRLRALEIPAVLLTGPMMAEDEVRLLRSAAEGLDVKIFESRPDVPDLLVDARAVVSMAGYCTTTEVLASGKPALMVPRVVPREEQFNRAKKLSAAGLVSLLAPTDLSAESLRAELDKLISQEPRAAAPLSGADDVREILLGATAVNQQPDPQPTVGRIFT